MERILVSIVILVALPAWAATPYLDKSVNLPEKVGDSVTIEAENYDRGFDEDAFHDLTPDNEGGVYRLDEVDLYKSQKGAIYIGAILPGEWTGYSVRNWTEGNFDLEIRTSSAFEAASMIVVVGDAEFKLPVPYSGDWDSWRLITLFNLQLPKGLIQIKLKTNTGNYFLDSFRLIRRPK
jgi:hypothetical protein